MLRRPLPHFAILASALAAACGGARKEKAPGTERVVTAAALDALPRTVPTVGGRVCLADGRTLCPLQSAVANWLAPGQFALWEPGRQVGVWRDADTLATRIGDFGLGTGKYVNPAAVGANAAGDVLVVDAQSDSLLRYNAAGKFLDARPLPKLYGLTAWGFAGRLPVLQRIAGKDALAPAELELRILNTAGDSAGRTALRTSLPWLHLSGSTVSSALPLFPTQPVYAIDEDGALVWSSGERLWLRRLAPSGAVEWTLSSDIKGPAIAPADIAVRRKELENSGMPAVDIDSMAARTPSNHAAVTGLLLSRDGRILVGEAVVPSADSLTYLLLAKDGAPIARLTLGKRVHPLLLSGDSLLVHRPTEGEPWEIRWLLFPKPH